MGAEKIFQLAILIFFAGHFFPEIYGSANIISQLICEINAVIVGLQFILLIEGCCQQLFKFKYSGTIIISKNII